MRRFRTVLLATSALIPLGLLPAAANPLGPKVVAGSATVQGQGTPAATVTQQTGSAIINWNTFNIGAGEKTNIVMPNANSVQLDRVTGALGPSQIFGSLWSNGRVFLVNPDGILFGPGAKIDTGSFLATTHDIANADFMAGRYNFSIPGNPNASIVNQGTITAQSGGFAALVAPGVRNSGTISATLGTVALASGNGFTLDFYGDKLITLGLSDSIATTVTDVATGQPLSALVRNEGTLKAGGGRIELTAVAARQVVDSVINNTGVIEANSIGTKNGMIVLGAATAATKLASAPAQIVKVSGKLSAKGKHSGQSGGTIQIIGEAIQVTGAMIDASGAAGGGTVLIGGDWSGGSPTVQATNPSAALQPYAVPTATSVLFDATSLVDVSATISGNGGKAVLWADQSTSFYGSILAHGGALSGDGGFVEVSARQQLAFTGIVDASAPYGKSGTLLLDPQDVTIGSAGTWVVTPQALQTALASSDVIVTTNSTLAGAGDITVAQSFSWNSPYALYLGAYRNIVIDGGVTIANTGAGSLNLGAGVTTPSGAPWYGNGIGTIIFNGSSKIDLSQSIGYVSFGYNPIGGYANPADFSAHVLTNSAVPQQFAAYMWVNNVNDLQNISQNLSGNYVLANNIDASTTASWNGGAGFIPIGNSTTPFTGLLVGVGGTVPFITLGGTINGLTIHSSGGSDLGLFGYIGPNGMVGNLGLINASIVGGANYVGAIAAVNSGAITNSFVTGSIIVNSIGGLTGGLVGSNAGTIEDSYSTASISTGSAVGLLGTGPNPGGGLVGLNSGTIIQSYATGSVTGGTLSGNGNAFLGGLVAENYGTIIQSYATGSVTFTPSGTNFYPSTNGVGGLVGFNANGTIIESYATGFVTSGGQQRSGGLIGSDYIGGPYVGGTIGNSYWDIQTTGQTTSDGGVGLTTAQLKSGLPTGFDPTVWGVSASINSGYPYLRWQFPNGMPPPPPPLPPPPPSTPPAVFYVESGIGAILNLAQIAGNMFPPGTFFIQSGTGIQFTPEQLGGYTASLPPTNPNTQITNVTQPASPSKNDPIPLISEYALPLVPTGPVSATPHTSTNSSTDVTGSTGGSQNFANQLTQALANLGGLDNISASLIVTLLGNAVDSAVQSTLLNPTQVNDIYAAFLENLKSENTVGMGTGWDLLKSVVTQALGDALQAEMHKAGYSDYLTQPTVFVLTLALNDGFAALNPAGEKFGGTEGAIVYASIKTTSDQLVKVAQQGVGLWNDIESLKNNFVTLNSNVDQLYALAKEQTNLGNFAESNRLLAMASSTQTTINNLRQEYTVGGVSILDSSGWNLLSIFAH